MKLKQVQELSEKRKAGEEKELEELLLNNKVHMWSRTNELNIIIIILQKKELLQKKSFRKDSFSK